MAKTARKTARNFSRKSKPSSKARPGMERDPIFSMYWGNSPKKRRASLNQVFGLDPQGREYPVEEAKLGIYIAPTHEDIAKAKPTATKCVYCQALMRMYGSPTALVLRTLAYVLMYNEKRQRVIMRFKLSTHAHRTTMQYDWHACREQAAKDAASSTASRLKRRATPNAPCATGCDKVYPIPNLGDVLPEPVIFRPPGKGHEVAEANKRARRYDTPQYKAAKAKREAKFGKRQKKVKNYSALSTFRLGSMPAYSGARV